MPVTSQQAKELVIGFDRGDVSWLRGYCHFLAALGELYLAVDGQKAFECSCPPAVRESGDAAYLPAGNSPRLRREPARKRTHVLGRDLLVPPDDCGCRSRSPPGPRRRWHTWRQASFRRKGMWKFILAETDDDHEWIPNPKQTGVVGVKVTQEMVDAWLETLDEAEQVLQGKKLIPFWRGEGTSGA